MTTEKKLKSSIYFDARNICKEVGLEHEMEFDQNGVDLIGELVWKKILLYGQDLEAFHKHAKRSTITIDDIKLLCRRNPSLKEFIEKECPQSSGKEKPPDLKRKRKASRAVTVD